MIKFGGWDVKDITEKAVGHFGSQSVLFGVKTGNVYVTYICMLSWTDSPLFLRGISSEGTCLFPNSSLDACFHSVVVHYSLSSLQLFHCKSHCKLPLDFTDKDSFSHRVWNLLHSLAILHFFGSFHFWVTCCKVFLLAVFRQSTKPPMWPSFWRLGLRF